MRLEVTRRTHLALEAMRALDETGGRIKGAELAKAIGTSTAFLAQVMTSLVRRRWVESVPGPSGGYVLAADPEQISLLELIETIEGPTDSTICVLEGRDCSTSDKCAIHDAWVHARTELTNALDSITLAEAARTAALS